MHATSSLGPIKAHKSKHERPPRETCARARASQIDPLNFGQPSPEPHFTPIILTKWALRDLGGFFGQDFGQPVGDTRFWAEILGRILV